MARINSALTLLVPVLACTAIHADEVSPAIKWTFDQPNTLPGQIVGTATVGAGGLTSPRYPDFHATNSVLELKSPSWIRIPDTAGDSKFDLDNGDEVTFEAWVRIRKLGDNVYLVGKGRTESTGPKSTNQNWAFRLRKVNGTARVNFLFRSRNSESHQSNWHRWTSKTGISSGSRWHHVAISYKFGDPKSIVGIIDGKKVTGSWDMGGPTTERPVIDNDDVWIGSAMGGNKGNSLDGWIDNLTIHRRTVPSTELIARYKWEPPPIKAPVIPDGKVVVELFDSVQSISEIPLDAGEPAESWQQEELGFTRLPYKYDSWGIRDDWGSTVLVRAWANITLPKGTHQLMARSRGLSRLKIDGARVLTTAVKKKSGSAHNLVADLPTVPMPGMRPSAMGDDEKIVSFESDGKAHRWLWEIIVGGPNFRLEFGETSLAASLDGGMFQIVSDVSQYPLTDQGWQQFRAEQLARVTKFDQKNRSTANATMAGYWKKRHSYAADNIQHSTNISTIDDVIQQHIRSTNAKVRQSRQTAANAPNTEFYTAKVQPILDAHCNRCHVEKQQGELLLTDRSNLLKGGESGQAAVIPHNASDSYLFQLVSAEADDYRMPPKGAGLSNDEVQTIQKWINDGAHMQATVADTISTPEIVDDHTFLRRIYVDTVGVPPTLTEAREFLADSSTDRRKKLIDKLLQDARWADNWTGYWQDVFAENPNLLKPTLNNTGPFRYWIHEALTDNKPMDRFATELILMRGSTWGGGTAGFSQASQNDVPMAAKAHVIGSAFLGINMKCARCHDAPYHQWKQGDLFQMAAMLGRKKLKLPPTSTVPVAFFEEQQRESLIEVTLKPGTLIDAHFPFEQLAPPVEDSLLQRPSDSREQLAAQVTASRRFAETIANRIWARLMGAGVVKTVDDWEGVPASNPKLLSVLADTLISTKYDARELARQIFESDAYQRKATKAETGGTRHFAGPYRRRMSAEQIVDTVFHSVGQPMQTELLTMDVEGAQPANRFLNYGHPNRSWEFTTLANERDRPSLALPRVQAIADLLKAFGWRNSRPEPATTRDEAPNLIQPGVLANGTVGVWLTRLSDDSGLTQLMLQQQTVNQLVDNLFLQVLTRMPTSPEREQFVQLLKPGFEGRVIPANEVGSPHEPKRFRYVSWSNHLNTEANLIKMEMQELARQGPPATRFLKPEWRERAEDAVWSLLNSPEMVLIP